MKKAIIVAISVVIVTDTLACQLPNYAWRLESPGLSPPPRTEHCMAWHPGSQRVVMFGGLSSASMSDTWTWAGNSWQLEAPASSPAPRHGHAMALDRSTGHVLLFGGTDGTQVFDDTWLWNGSGWVQQNGAVRPSARWNSALSWNPDLGSLGNGVILFGGSDGSGDLGDTWRWNGFDWSMLQLAHAPSPRSGHVLVEVRESSAAWVMLYGGSSGASEVHRLYAGDWELFPFPVPSGPRINGAATFDASRNKAVVFGGAPDCRVWTWELSPLAEWVPTAAHCGPAGRTGHAMAFDELRDKVLMFGGSAGEVDTWTVGELPFVQVAIGFGCGGAMGGLYGDPAEVRWAMHDPWLASPSGILVSPLQVGFVAYGLSSLSPSVDIAQIVSLPHACSLHVYPDVVSYATSSVPGNWDVALPSIPYGVTDLFAQGFMAGVGGFPGSFYLSSTPAFRIL